MTTRATLPDAQLTSKAREAITGFHGDTVREVERAVAAHDVVVVGMAQNPHVKKVRKALDDANVPYTYLGYGSYVSEWKKRLAIKMWSGWPTFPQVFVKGRLVGGEDLTKAALADGSLQEWLRAGRNG